MTFQWAPMLWLLFVVPVLVIGYVLLLRRRRQSAVRYASLSLVREAMGKGPGFRRHIPALLFLIAFTVMIVALARPQANVRLPSERGTVILALDISGSMRATDIVPSRIVAAQRAARDFVTAQPRNVRVGVVAFAGTATLVQAPTTNRDDILAAISRVRTQRATAIGSGILTSLAAIFEGTDVDIGLNAQGLGLPPAQQNDPNQAGRQGGSDPSAQGAPLGQPDHPAIRPVAPGSYTSAVVILLSDGQSNTGPDPIQAANRAADLGVRIFTVGLGTRQGKIVGFGGWSMRVQLDEEALKTIADVTHARYFRAGSDTELAEIYHSLSTQLITEAGKNEITALFVALAGLVALISVLLSLVWFNRIA